MKQLRPIRQQPDRVQCQALQIRRPQVVGEACSGLCRRLVLAVVLQRLRHVSAAAAEAEADQYVEEHLQGQIG